MCGARQGLGYRRAVGNEDLSAFLRGSLQTLHGWIRGVRQLILGRAAR